MPIFGEGSNEKDYSQLLSELTTLNQEADYIDPPNQCPFLHTAVINNNLQGFRAVIDYYRKKYPQQKTQEKYSFKEAINLRDKDGNTALHYACRLRNLEFVKILMDDKADDKIANAANNLPLHFAVGSLKSDVVEYLLTKRPLNFLWNLIVSNSEDDGSNADNNYQEAKFNAINNDGVTPLLMALSLPARDAEAEINKEKIIIALLDKYSQLEFTEDSTIEQLANSSYLLIAIQKKLSLVVIARIIQKTPLHLNAKNADGLTALHLAVMAKDKALVALLLENYIKPFETNNAGQTALHLAAERQYIDADILELLLVYFKDHGKIDPLDVKGNTPFYIAASHCDENIARLFIDYGANVNATDIVGNTPFHRAAIAVTQARSDDASIKHQHTYFYLYDYANRTLTNEAGKSAAEIFEHYLTNPPELTEVNLDDSSHEPNSTDVTDHQAVTTGNSYSRMAAAGLSPDNTPLRIDAIRALAASTPISSARSEDGLSTKPLLPKRVSNNPNGLLERLNNYRISLWRKFKATVVGRFVRRHPYISAAILTIALTGFVALCIFAAPVAAKIAILSGVKIALTKMKIFSTSSSLLDPIAKTVAMLLPTIGVAIVGAAIKLGRYLCPCLTRSKVATEISVSNSTHSPQSKNDKSPQLHTLQKANDNTNIAVPMPQKTTSFSIRDYLPACLFSCFKDCNRQRTSSVNQYEIILSSDDCRQQDTDTALALHDATSARTGVPMARP